MANLREQQIKLALQSDIFPTSFIYSFHKFLHSQKGISFFKIQQKDRPKSKFLFSAVQLISNLNYNFSTTHHHGPLSKQGFSATQVIRKEKNITGDSTRYCMEISHEKFNSEVTLEEARVIWLENIRRDFIEDRESFPGRMYDVVMRGRDSEWDQDGKKIIVFNKKAMGQYEDAFCYPDFGFSRSFCSSRSAFIFEHQLLDRNSPIDVWIWIREFSYHLQFLKRIANPPQKKKKKPEKQPKLKANSKSNKKPQMTIKSQRLLVIDELKNYLDKRFSQDAQVQEPVITKPKSQGNRKLRKRKTYLPQEMIQQEKFIIQRSQRRVELTKITEANKEEEENSKDVEQKPNIKTRRSNKKQ